uniref:Glutamine cyclotransferase n=1 Tax=Peronospora matthiolae TaxID=2874970 RepID=A0AAV1TUU2_9STRA
MARTHVSKRPKQQGRGAPSTREKDRESTTKEIGSEEKRGMLLPLLASCGVALVVMALGVLLRPTQPQGLIPTPVHDLNSEEQARVEAREERPMDARPTVEFLAKYPHDAAAFTQGFTVVNRGDEKLFIESTGLYGKSTLRRVDIESGKVVKQYDLPEELFGEGVTLGPNNELVMLTWKSKSGFVFNLDETADGEADGFALRSKFSFDTTTGEGWGITFDGKDLVVSDGSSTVMFWDPLTKKEVRRIEVTIYNGNQPIAHVNELEIAKGFIYANVWYQPYILKIDPETGAVVTMFDLSKLLADAGADISAGEVLNGIAYDDTEDVFYVTGKLWNSVYKIRLVDPVQ